MQASLGTPDPLNPLISAEAACFSLQGLQKSAQGTVSRKPRGIFSQDHAESHEIELRNFAHELVQGPFTNID